MSQPKAEPLTSALTLSLPPPPPPELDACLDAASACLVRHGISRTTIADIARAKGVSRTTVYREIGSVENAVALLAARDMHRFFARVPEMLRVETGPTVVSRIVAEFVRFTLAHPVSKKLMRDEPTFLGEVLSDDLSKLLQENSQGLVPALDAAMKAGFIRRTDPQQLGGWLMRVITILLLAPPPGDIKSYLEEFVVPALVPVDQPRQAQRRPAAQSK